MQVAKIRRDSPEQVYVTVRNNDSTAMSVGHAVMWEFPIVASGTGTGDGYSVKYAVTTATQQANPGLFAGVIAGADIPSGQYGSCQVYGYHTGVYVTGGASGAPFESLFFSVTNRASASLTNRVLRPVAAFANTTGAATNAGYLGVVSVATSIAGTQTYVSTDVNQALVGLWPGGYVLALGNINGNVSITHTSSGSVKAFIKAL